MEVTKQQLAAILDNPHHDENTSPSAEHPANSVSFDMAAMYCNLLSKQAGYSESDFCYEVKNGKAIAYPDFLQRRGFRLPLESEWEYACASDSAEPVFFHNRDSFSELFAWHLKNSNAKTQPVGRLWPNRFGLFDTFGNTEEWVHRECESLAKHSECLKGHAFSHPHAILDRSYRLLSYRSERLKPYGFRIAQTLFTN